MKKLLFTLLTVASLSFITACGGNSSSTSTNSSTTTTPSVDSTPIITPTPEIDYTTNISCEAGSIEKELYTFTTVNPNEENYYDFNDPEISIVINQADWKHVTGFKTPVVNIQNEDVLKSDALTFKETTVESSNIINGFTLKLDRTKLKVGETKIKFAIKPSNGVNTAKPLELTFGLKVVEFGSIDPTLFNATVSLDLTKLDSKYEGKQLEFVVFDNSHEYGYSFKKNEIFTISEDKTVNIKLPKGHNLELFLRTVEDRPQPIYLEFTSDDSYSVTENILVFSKEPTKTLEATIK